MVPWVIMLPMHIFLALCDPWGSCDDKDQSVAGEEAAWGVPPLYVAATPPPLTDCAPIPFFSLFFNDFSGLDFQ